MACCGFFRKHNRNSYRCYLSTDTTRNTFVRKVAGYTAFYTDAYKAKAKGIQLTYAIIGFVIPFALIFLLLLGGG
jgi:hypothetical protein